MKIATYTGGIASTNGYACHVEGGCFLVDAPDGMAAWVEANQWRPHALLLTHAHFDHVLDAAALQERFGCAIYAFAEPTPELTLEVLFASFGPALTIAPYRLDHRVDAKTPLEVCGQRFQVLEIPGHSADSIAFLPENTDRIFSGDVLMQGGIGRDDLPGGDGPLLREGIRTQLYTLDDAVQVFPGHGGPTTIGEEKRSNPFVRV